MHAFPRSFGDVGTRLQRGLLGVIAGLFFSVAVPAVAQAEPCEQAVVAQCVSTSCPTFCEGQADAAACLASCTAKDRCKLALFGAQDRKDQKPLDSQNRAQLMACLEENRADIHVDETLGAPILIEEPAEAEPAPEPAPAPASGTVADKSAKSGKWKQVKSPSFADVVAPPADVEPQPAPQPKPKPKRGKRAKRNKAKNK